MGIKRVDEQLGALGSPIPYLSTITQLTARKEANYETVSDMLSEFESCW